MSIAQIKPWELQPGETPKAFAAFQTYLKMPLVGAPEEKRTLANLARKLGLSATSGVEGWSSKYNWQERTIAYDAYMASAAITVRESALREFQQAVITSMGAQLAVLNQILDTQLANTREAQERDGVSNNDLKKLVDSLAKKDDLARRMAGLPTQYRSEQADEPDEDDIIYVIGG